MFKKLLSLAAVLLFSVATAFATTWYVDDSGSDSNNCSAAQSSSTPKLTIAAALACVGAVGAAAESGADDFVVVLAGNYIGEDLTDLTPSGGTAAHPFTLKCVTDLACIFQDGNLRWINTGAPTHKSITIRGFDFVGDNLITAGAEELGAFPDFVWEYNRLRDNPVFVWGDFAGGDRWILRHNTVTHSGYGCDGPGGLGEGYCHSIYIASYNRDWLIEDNDWSDNNLKGGYCIHIYPGEGIGSGQAATGFIIRRNIFKNCGKSGVGGAGIVAYGENFQIYNNIVYNSLNGIILRTFGPALVDFNTFYNNVEWGILNQGMATCRNNIAYISGAGIVDCNTASNNLTTDPSFVNAAIGDFHLFDTSSALGAGVAISGIDFDFDNEPRPNPPAIGALEIPSGIDPQDPLSEDFNSYSAGISIDCLNGGAGWTQCWQLISGAVTVENSPAWMSGKSLRHNATATAEARRLFTAHSGAFTISFKASLSITNPNDYIYPYLMDQSGNTQIRIFFSSVSGNIVTDTQTLVAGYVANTLYAFDIDLDTENQPGKYRVRVNGGAYSSWEDSLSSFTGIAGIGFVNGATNAHVFWMDDILDVVGVAGAGTITVVTPAIAQKCVSESSCQISWASNGISGNVNLYYLVGGNQYLITTVDVAATPYSWTVNAPAGTSSQIRVSQGSVTDDGELFTIYGRYFK